MAKAEDDRSFTARQLRDFKRVVATLSREGLRPPLVHAANSAAAVRHPESRFDLVRPGLAAYGLYPGFAPVLTLKSKIVYIKTAPKGAVISYGATWKAKRVSRIATLPIGYGDGYPRALSNRAAVIVGGKRCPVVGRVTMDQTMIDVTDAPRARVGDDAVLIGPSSTANGRGTSSPYGSVGGISAGDLARICGTIPYETVTAISTRVPRVAVGA